MIDVRSLVGASDIVLLTLDTLRHDSAQAVFREGRLPTLARYLGPDGWERRHSPATFTYAAHHAFLSGFLPTPPEPGPHPRLFAAEFAGSVSTTDTTWVFSQATIPEALAAEGYRTICIGGTGFFNLQNELGRVLPGLFQERHWSPELGVTCPTSTENQVSLAIDRLHAAGEQRAFLFINISAIHQPNWHHGGTEGHDTLETHGAALAAVDAALAPLFETLETRGRFLCIACSDHGTAYGEDGHQGHRIAHEVVWNVPYAEFVG
ncbi:MAG: STM4013/SEN3800 family hydrolase [Acidobacteriota bacterium]